MTTYLCEVTFGLVVEADSEEDAMDKAREFENRGWTAILDDVEVWESEVESKGIDESEGEE